MEFRILGPLEVAEDGGQLDLGGQKPRALLAILLLHANEVVSSDRLIDALWEEAPPETAHKALQVYVSGLRKILGKERLETKAPGYRLRVHEDELDLERFALLAEARPREALALWRGEPLAEFSYQRFAQAEIARLEELRLACLERRIEDDLEQGRHAALVSGLERLVSEHPLRERLRVQLILALYRSGRQAEALEAYQEARQTLTEELGIEPSQELRELQQRILRQDAALEVARADKPIADAEASTGVFVGREAELAAVRSGLEAAFAGHGSLFLLVGEPGIGKSRLAEEVARDARGRGARVVVGRAWEAGGAPAYWPWVQSLRALVSEIVDERLRGLLDVGAGELASLLPELRERFPDVPPPSEQESEVARFRLFEAASSLLRRNAQRTPIVLVLDDLHAADEPSLLMLRFVARELSRARVLVLAAYRDVDPTPTDPLTIAVTELLREPVTQALHLSGLRRGDVARFTEVISGEAPSEDLVATIHEETEGNPLFVGEIVRLLASEGRLHGADGSEVAIPQTVRDVIARRLRHLSDESNRVLNLASVLGREFSLEALTRMAEVTEEELFDILDEAIHARVLSDLPGSVGRLRFAHVLIRDTLYEELTTVRRIGLHRRARQALAEVYGADPGAHLAELALHAAAGGEFAEAAVYARRAGDRALALLAYEEAARLYRTALDALESSPTGEASARCDLLLALGEALSKAGDTAEAKATFVAATDVAREARLPEHLARGALGYGGRFYFARAGSDERLVPLLEEAMAALGEDKSVLRVRVLARLAGALRDQPSLQPRGSLSREAVAIARDLDDRETLLYALVGFFWATVGPDLEELVPTAEEITRLADEIGGAEPGVQARWCEYVVWMTLGDIESARRAAEQYGALADVVRQPTQQWYSLVRRSVLALFSGDFADAEQLAERASVLGYRAQRPDAGFSYRAALFQLRREQGRLNEIEDLIRSSIHEYPGYRSFRCLAVVLDCDLARLDDARAGFDVLAADDFSALPRDIEWLFCMSILSEVAAQLDDRERTTMLHTLLAPYEHLNATAAGEIALGSVARYLGILASATSRWDAAEKDFEDALAMNRRMGARPWVAHTQEDYARMLLARGDAGDVERAEPLLNEALATYRELGMTGALERARARPV
jgi:DNA-binding SARP family transcriptional activator